MLRLSCHKGLILEILQNKSLGIKTLQVKSRLNLLFMMDLAIFFIFSQLAC